MHKPSHLQGLFVPGSKKKGCKSRGDVRREDVHDNEAQQDPDDRENIRRKRLEIDTDDRHDAAGSAAINQFMFPPSTGRFMQTSR